MLKFYYFNEVPKNFIKRLQDYLMASDHGYRSMVQGPHVWLKTP